MAAVSVVLGGILGFITSVIAYLAFGLTILQTLGLWSGTGLAASLTLILLGTARPVAASKPDGKVRLHA